MEIFDKAGRAVGDAIARARERERFRLQDKVGQLDILDACARVVVQRGKDRPGYVWDQEVERNRLGMISAAAMIGDDALRSLVDGLCAIDVPIPSDLPAPRQELDSAYRALVARLAELRRETLADDD